MINWTLYKRELKGSVKLLVIFAAILTMYIAIIISMYNPTMMATLDSFAEVMPELMASVGMYPGATDLLGFMISYLYGFILLVLPMVFAILRSNSLVAKYVDRGSMAALMAAPVKRRTIVFTQMSVLLSGILLLWVYHTALEAVLAQTSFPGELALSDLLRLNAGLLCLHIFIGGICFLASCLFSDTRYSMGFGAGIPALMYVLQMLANVGEQAEPLKYVTLFTLFDPNGITAGTPEAAAGVVALLLGSILLFSSAILIFTQKDLHI